MGGTPSLGATSHSSVLSSCLGVWWDRARTVAFQLPCPQPVPEVRNLYKKPELLLCRFKSSVTQGSRPLVDVGSGEGPV